MSLSKITWEDISDDIRAEEVVDALGIQITEIRGYENMARCPMSSHPGADRKPSFSINVDKKVANCFVCGGVSFIDLVMQIEDLDETDAIAWLLQFSDYDNDDDEQFMRKIVAGLNKKTDPPEPRYYDLPHFAMSTIERFVDTPTDFYTRRRISSEARKALKLGYDNSHTHRKYTAPCAIIPLIFRGTLVGYQRRWDSPEEEWPESIGKYMNTEEFPKAHTLYGYDLALQSKSRPVFVVESALTVARLISAGYSAVSTFGASSNPCQIKLLSSFDHLVLSPDRDKPGESAARRLYKALDDLCIVEYIPPPPDDKSDLGDADDDMLEDLISQIEPAFLHFAAL